MARRELIDTGPNRRYLRRNLDGPFSPSIDGGRSFSADKRHKAKGDAKSRKVSRRSLLLKALTWRP